MASNVFIVGNDNEVPAGLSNVVMFGDGMTAGASDSFVVGPSMSTAFLGLVTFAGGVSGGAGPTGPTGPAGPTGTAGATAEAVVSPSSAIAAGATKSSAVGNLHEVDTSSSFAAGAFNWIKGSADNSVAMGVGNLQDGAASVIAGSGNIKDGTASGVLLLGINNVAGTATVPFASYPGSVLVGVGNVGPGGSTFSLGSTGGVALGRGNIVAPSGVALGIGASGLADQTVIGGTALFTGPVTFTGGISGQGATAEALVSGGAPAAGSTGVVMSGISQTVSGSVVTAIGRSNEVDGTILQALGIGNSVQGLISSAIGAGNRAWGQTAGSTGSFAIAIGNANAIGLTASAGSQAAGYSVAIGNYNIIPEESRYSMAVGRGCTGASGGVALGIGASGIAGEVAVGGTCTFQQPVTLADFVNLTPTGSTPASPVEGQVFYYLGGGPKFYDGAVWRAFDFT